MVKRYENELTLKHQVLYGAQLTLWYLQYFAIELRARNSVADRISYFKCSTEKFAYLWSKFFSKNRIFRLKNEQSVKLESSVWNWNSFMEKTKHFLLNFVTTAVEIYFYFN